VDVAASEAIFSSRAEPFGLWRVSRGMSKDASLTLDVAALPDDPALLKQLIAQIRREAAEQLEALRQRMEAEHKAAMLALLRRYYGPRSETFDPRQLLLFGQRIDQLPLDEPSIAEEADQPLVTRRIASRHRHGRQQLPAALERIEIEHDLAQHEQNCPACGTRRRRLGAEVSEQLEYFPASFKVLRHIRHKYACARCEQEGYDPQITAAAKPAQPIDKGLPGPSLLAYLVTSKLGDHLPLYRLERIFARQGVEIARSTMCAWLRCAGELVKPLVDLLAERVRKSRAIHTDDTPVPIQSPGAKQCRKGRIWCYVGDAAHPYIVYDYTPRRSRDGPAQWLAGYQGYLQADAYGGYDGIFAGGEVFEVACWAHARRKFYDAQDSDGRRAAQMLALIGELYALEREAQAADEAARLAMRQQRGAAVLERIKAWLDSGRHVVLPGSPLAQAITYAQNQWQALTTYATQGYLAIDNNAAERALKRVAIGRKNWLFAGNDAAAENAARLWSLIASCERHQIDPQRYLTSVLAKVGTVSAQQLDQFLPDLWAQDDADEPRLPEAAT
jgi:transposase